MLSQIHLPLLLVEYITAGIFFKPVIFFALTHTMYPGGT